MITNHQTQISQNPLLSSQTSQSVSYPIIQSSQHQITPTDSNKPSMPSSSTSIITEPIENSLISISPSHTNEANQTSISSDTPIQAPVSKKKHIKLTFLLFIFH